MCRKDTQCEGSRRDDGEKGEVLGAGLASVGRGALNRGDMSRKEKGTTTGVRDFSEFQCFFGRA